MSSSILIIDFGSQVTQLIARRLREAGIFAEILPCMTDPEKLKLLGQMVLFCPAGQTLRSLPMHPVRRRWSLT